MADSDKLGDKADEVKGRIEEKIGEVTDDEELARKGERDQAGAKLHQAADKVKDAAKDVFGH
jgi:uncharacterized protein YjbJ (UPF0337 family)